MRPKPFVPIMGSLVASLVFVTSGLAMSDGKVYWTDANNSGGAIARVLRANLDGLYVEPLITPPSLNSRFIALDLTGRKMYWTDIGRIDRANFDGTGIVTLVTGTLCPLGVALDVAGGKIYWTDCSAIRRANLADGSGVEDVVIGLSAPRGLALELASGKMYWTDPGTGKIQRANLDGSSQQDLVTGLTFPQGIALDVDGGKMYWPDSATIRRANLDGSSLETLLPNAGNPIGIALDQRSGKMYWTENQTNKIQRANLDGTGVEDLVATGLDTPWGIALDLTPRPDQDFNGDGKADIGVFRQTTGEWFVLRSSNSTLLQVQWGAPSLGDVPLTAGTATTTVDFTLTPLPILDQSNVTFLTFGGSGAPGSYVTASQTVAQTFTVGISGLLKRIDVGIYRENGASGVVTLDILPASVFPASNLSALDASLYSTTIPIASVPLLTTTLTSVDVSANLSVTSGQQLAIVLRRSAGSPQVIWQDSDPASPYPGGSHFNYLSGPQWLLQSGDHRFQTWVSP